MVYLVPTLSTLAIGRGRQVQTRSQRSPCGAIPSIRGHLPLFPSCGCIDPRLPGTQADSRNPGDKMICFGRSNPGRCQLDAGTGGSSRAVHRGIMDAAALAVFVRRVRSADGTEPYDHRRRHCNVQEPFCRLRGREAVDLQWIRQVRRLPCTHRQSRAHGAPGACTRAGSAMTP